ncbi:hypothetical protein GCM10022248_27600 [Nonomuraea soli]
MAARLTGDGEAVRAGVPSAAEVMLAAEAALAAEGMLAAEAALAAEGMLAAEVASGVADECWVEGSVGAVAGHCAGVETGSCCLAVVGALSCWPAVAGVAAAARFLAGSGAR